MTAAISPTWRLLWTTVTLAFCIINIVRLRRLYDDPKVETPLVVKALMGVLFGWGVYAGGNAILYQYIVTTGSGIVVGVHGRDIDTILSAVSAATMLGLNLVLLDLTPRRVWERLVEAVVRLNTSRRGEHTHIIEDPNRE